MQSRARLRERLEAKYPDLRLTDTQLDNYLDAQDRSAGQPTEPIPQVGKISVHRATPDRLDDVLDFFDHRAFAGNPGWGACYCMYHHLGGDMKPAWEERAWQDNRSSLARRIQEGETRGYLAYDGDKVVGWLNASPRSSFPDHATGEDDGIASIVCFNVAPSHRGHGIGRLLLQAAIDELSATGTHRIEAYPVPDHVSDAAAYKGREKLFLEHGFEFVEGAETPTVSRTSRG